MKKFLVQIILASSFFIIYLSFIQETFAQSQFQFAIWNTQDAGAFYIKQLSNGDYIAAGENDFGMNVVNLSSTGSLQWSEGITGTDYYCANSFVQTTDGGCVFTGYIDFFVGQFNNMFIVKLSSTGSLQWSKTVGGTYYDEAYSILQTTDGGYALAGESGSFGAGGYDMYIVKLDSNGSLQWSKTVGGTNNDFAYSIIQTRDGGYAVAGSTESFGGWDYDMFIVKLSSNGTLQWSKTVGGTGWDEAHSIIQTTDGGYAVAGKTDSYGAGNFDMYIVKLDSNGLLKWTRTVGGTSDDEAYSIIQTTDGGYAVAGYTWSFGAGYYDMYIVKLTSNGSLQWSKTVGGTDDEEARSIIQTVDGGYAVAGYTKSFQYMITDMYIVKLDANGNTCANSTSPSSITGTGGTETSPTPTIITPTPTVTTTFPTVSSGGIFIVTPICLVGIKSESTEIPKQFSLYQNYPNPFNPSTKIKYNIPLSRGVDAPGTRDGRGVLVILKIYDILGREIATLVNEKQNPGSYGVIWDASNYPSGVYFYKLTVSDPATFTKGESKLYFSQTKRMVLIK